MMVPLPLDRAVLVLFRASAPPWASIAFLTTAAASWAATGKVAATATASPSQNLCMGRCLRMELPSLLRGGAGGGVLKQPNPPTPFPGREGGEECGSPCTPRRRRYIRPPRRTAPGETTIATP